jgi:pyrroloquinoline quinone (PQQ) biosynthesis protein C
MVMVYINAIIRKGTFTTFQAEVHVNNLLLTKNVKVISKYYPTIKECVVTYLCENGEYGVQHFKEA